MLPDKYFIPVIWSGAHTDRMPKYDLIDCMINPDCHNNKDEMNHAASIKEQILGKKTRQRNKSYQIPDPQVPSHANVATISISPVLSISH